MIIKNGMYLSNLQSYFFGFILILFMGFIACEKSNEELLSIDFGKAIDLEKSESVFYGSSSQNGLKVNVEEIYDSRCPLDVVCIWQGEAKVKLNIKSNIDSTSITLGISPNINDSLSFKLNKENYQAILYSVNPYPNTSKPKDGKKAKITINKR